MDVIERSTVEEEGGRRVLMCEVCEEAAAAVACKADAALLCLRCDADIHSANPLAHRHQRVPISAHLDGRDGDVPSSFLSDHHDHNQNQKQNHDQSAVWCGDLAFSEEYYETDGLVVDFTKSSSTSATSIIGTNMKIGSDGILFPWINYPTQSVSSSMISDVGVVPDGMNCVSDISGKRESSSSSSSSNSFILSGGTGRNMAIQDREARVMRYREKRQRRKFQKTIRYASRKAYAETRPRVKGRFAKRNDDNNKSINILSDLVPDLQYGVAPYF